MDIDMYRELSETEAIAEEDEIWQYYQEANGLAIFDNLC
jgi:hypothetical protein